jgi:predicted Zn-dependent protease
VTAELDLAGRVVELVRAAAGPAAQAEALVDHGELALTRFANSSIHQNVAAVTTAVRLRLHLDGRTAAGSTTITSAAGLEELVERTVAAARLCPPDPGWPGLAAPAAPVHGGRWDASAAQASADERAARVRAFVDAAGGLETAGYCRTQHRAGGFANSAGQAVAGRTSEAAMDAIARLAGADGVVRFASVGLADVDGAALGARAAAKARAGTDRVQLPPGRYEVVLEPSAVMDVLQNLAMYGFNGKAYAERTSFVELGAEQFDAAVTLVDDAAGPDSPGLPFDAEGTPKRRLTLVAAGTTRAVAHDRRSAAMAGASSTGHATPMTGAWGPIARNLRLEPAPAGAAADGPAAGGERAAVDPAAAPLIGGVARGLLVTDLWYTRVLDPKSLVVTGLTRNGVWLVEDGVVTVPVRDLRFTQSYPQALGPGTVLGVGAAAMLPDSWGTGWWTAPALRLAAWNFTGGASG